MKLDIRSNNPGASGRSPISADAESAAPPRTHDVYVEIFPLLLPYLTGVGRFAARLVQAVNALTPLRMTTVFDLDRAHLHPLAIAQGEEIPVEQGALADDGEDLSAWADRVFQLPRRRRDEREAAARTGIYLGGRPARRHFRREIGIFYDFTPLIVPWTHEDALRRAFHEELKASSLSDKMLAISHSTRDDALWLSPVPPADVVVAYPGPSQCLSRHAHPGPVARRENMILVVGTREPRKNLDFLLDWFLHSEVLDSRYELWWVGPKGWLWDGPQVDGGHPRLNRVKFLGMVPDARLCELYRQAAFTVYPSLYEGFGFPVLDSLLHGAPVLSSYHSSLAELESPGVFYFDPCDSRTLDAACHEFRAAGDLQIDSEQLRSRFCWRNLAQTVISMANSSASSRRCD